MIAPIFAMLPTPALPAPPVDGRQSERALAIARGVTRLLAALDFAVVPELPLPSGRRADLTALGRDGRLWIVEIKSSVEDFRTDVKWQHYRPFCDRFFFASHVGVPEGIFPAEAGFILCDAFGAAVMRDNEKIALAPATRKAMTIEIARLAALRLNTLLDPESGRGPEF